LWAIAPNKKLLAIEMYLPPSTPAMLTSLSPLEWCYSCIVTNTQFTVGEGGRWKSVDNEISETYPDGRKVVRFQPVPAYATSDAMQRLHEQFNRLFESEEIEPLLLIPTYILDFLCIHPFSDGNGRMLGC
jgi:Fic family protein